MVPICGIGFCFVIAAYYTTLPTGSGPDEMAVASFFAQTMINVVIITGFCAVLQASLVCFIHKHELFFYLIN
jgi:hypothetical protein